MEGSFHGRKGLPPWEEAARQAAKCMGVGSAVPAFYPTPKKRDRALWEIWTVNTLKAFLHWCDVHHIDAFHGWQEHEPEEITEETKATLLQIAACTLENQGESRRDDGFGAREVTRESIVEEMADIPASVGRKSFGVKSSQRRHLTRDNYEKAVNALLAMKESERCAAVSSGQRPRADGPVVEKRGGSIRYLLDSELQAERDTNLIVERTTWDDAAQLSEAIHVFGMNLSKKEVKALAAVAFARVPLIRPRTSGGQTPGEAITEALMRLVPFGFPVPARFVPIVRDREANAVIVQALEGSTFDTRTDRGDIRVVARGGDDA
jgi:hypothetical protein